MSTQPTTGIPSALTTSVDDAPDWVTSIPENRRKHLRRWLWTGAALTASTLIIGGVTRLTESGLSIVDWDPIVGAIPPITHGDWVDAFDRYKQYPEYVKVRPDMNLGEFQYIYFWEYLHRNVGRLLGLVFLLPFLLFWIRGYFNGPLLRRVLLLFVLGGLEGLMGWYMVSSGLVDRPDVSQIRLAAHLSLAVIIFGSCVWLGNDLLHRAPAGIPERTGVRVKRALIGTGVLLRVQIFWGGLVAGLKAGLSFATFPLDGRWTATSRRVETRPRLAQLRGELSDRPMDAPSSRDIAASYGHQPVHGSVAIPCPHSIPGLERRTSGRDRAAVCLGYRNIAQPRAYRAGRHASACGAAGSVRSADVPPSSHAQRACALQSIGTNVIGAPAEGATKPP